MDDAGAESNFDMSEPLIDDIDVLGHPYGNGEGRGITREGKLDKSKLFPPHWGKPPVMQTRDLVKLPYGFGFGSSTLAHWIKKKMQTDHQSE